jgi:fatty acid/phospholipid biosynthesis enzyme
MGASELVVKCHGQSSKQMLQKALIQTKALLSNEFIAGLKTYLAKQRTL